MKSTKLFRSLLVFILFTALALSSKISTVSAAVTYTFNKSYNVQSFTSPIASGYIINAYGGQGWASDAGTYAYGGLPSHAWGTINLAANQTIYLYVAPLPGQGGGNPDHEGDGGWVYSGASGSSSAVSLSNNTWSQFWSSAILCASGGNGLAYDSTPGQSAGASYIGGVTNGGSSINSSTMNLITLTSVDTQGPTNFTLSTTSPGWSNQASVSIGASSTDPSGVAGYQWCNDGYNWTGVIGGAYNFYDEGAWNLQCIAVDGLGNKSPPVSIWAGIDRTVATATEAHIANKDATGYDVIITGLSDGGSGAIGPLMPTWTDANGHDDITWDRATLQSGNTWIYHVATAAHNNETGLDANYQTDIYLDDNAGNRVFFTSVRTALVKDYDSSYISDTIPATLQSGVSYSYTATFKNTGSTTWNANEQYSIGADANQVIPGRISYGQGASTPTGSNYTYTVSFTTPQISVPSKIYTDNLRTVRESASYAAWFGNNQAKIITLVNSPPTCGTYSGMISGSTYTNDQIIIPSITVSDTNNDNVTCTLYLDGVSYDTQHATGTTSIAKIVNFKNINMADLNIGSHTFTYYLQDGANSNVQSGPFTFTTILANSIPQVNIITPPNNAIYNN